MTEEMKTCTKCSRVLPISSFYATNKNARCKECFKLYVSENRKRYWANQTLKSHRHKGFEILITTDELIDIAEQTSTCKWCGRKLQWENGLGNTGLNPTLDRKNNEHHIGIENVAIICHTCNTSKGRQSEKEFKQYIKRMYEVTILGD